MEAEPNGDRYQEGIFKVIFLNETWRILAKYYRY